MKKNEQTLQEQFEALQLRNKIRFGRKFIAQFEDCRRK